MVERSIGRSGSRRTLNRRRLFAAGSGAMALAAACGGGTKSGGNGASSSGPASGTSASGSGTPKRGGRLTQLNVTSTNNLNPVTNYAEGATLGGVHVYDRLISQRPNKDFAKEYVLEAAQSVEQPDSTTVIFKLRPGMKYQNLPPVNGRAVTADDIVKTQLYVRDNPGSQDKSFQTVSMDNVSAPDDQTVVFKLKAPNAYLFSGTQMCYPASNCIIPKEILDNLDTVQVGSGPYQLADYQMNVRYFYKRFDGFRDTDKGRPYIDEREWRIIGDAAAQESAFRSEQVQIWRVPLPSIADTVKKDLGSKTTLLDFLSLSMVTFSANVTKPPWNDVRIREALYRILNRQQYLDLLDMGRGKVPPGTLSVGLSEYQLDPKQTEKYWHQDAKAAKQLLDAAGFDFNREVEMSTIDMPRNNQGMQIFQQQAAQVGMKVKLTPMPFAQWLNQKILTGNWETWYAQHPAYDSPQLYLRLQHTKTLSVHAYNGLKDPEVDKMIEKSEQTLDRNERVKLVKDIQIALLEKYTPFIITHNFTDYYALWNYVKDYELNPATQPMYRTEMWLDK